MPPKKNNVEKEEVEVCLWPLVRDGEFVLGVAHIYPSFNDTFEHVTDLVGREKTVRLTGCMKVKPDRDEASSRTAAVLAIHDVAEKWKNS